ncbi:MAG: DUF86 domain-containing protein [Chitinophagales bacterium]
MTRGPQLYLRDIVDSIENIQRYIGDMSFDDFVVNKMAVDAVIRNFEIIGEAASHVPDTIKGLYPEVPWLEMKGLRNIVAHEYFGVDLRIIWTTVHQSLPSLLLSVLQIIDELG